ncbi:hypothetical protein [Streptomyces cinnamoneus]|uniref:ASCH domain-containing protein n=1 Tax=Streptomyces cinnamoneus TaxID=53446 RepID=A0A918TN84_STRCJ|nr:hypothetical protein [Streptomyces cinnamoneus]GHC52313.1 hypothetical protein GCM10010507_30530 [Streptomyces cinnamoneus]
MNTSVVRALTVSQPWASAIAYGTQRVINHPEPTDYRGPLLVHAGHRTDFHAWRTPLTRPFLRRPQPTGAVLAVAWLEDCHPGDGYCTLWSLRDMWHWRLSTVTCLASPVPWHNDSPGPWAPPALLRANPRIVEALEAARA